MLREDGNHENVGCSQTFYQFFITDTAWRCGDYTGLKWPMGVTYPLNLILVRSDVRVVADFKLTSLSWKRSGLGSEVQEQLRKPR